MIPRLTLFVPFILLMFGCSTRVVSIKYEPTTDLVIGSKDNHPVKVGNFVDNRGSDSRWLGSVPSGYGNVLKTLLMDEPTSAVVQAAFVAALQLIGTLKAETSSTQVNTAGGFLLPPFPEMSDEVTAALVGAVVGVVVSFSLTFFTEWWKGRARRLAHWAALGAEIDYCRDRAEIPS